MLMRRWLVDVEYWLISVIFDIIIIVIIFVIYKYFYKISVFQLILLYWVCKYTYVHVCMFSDFASIRCRVYSQKIIEMLQKYSQLFNN